MTKVDFLRCMRCRKVVSTGFIPVPTDTPDGGLVVRAFIECPECIEKSVEPEPVEVTPPPPDRSTALRLLKIGAPIECWFRTEEGGWRYAVGTVRNKAPYAGMTSVRVEIWEQTSPTSWIPNSLTDIDRWRRKV